MFKLCYSSIKGGVGKSSLTILMAKYIDQIMRQKVLLVDLDFQNSTSFHFIQEDDERNVANALFNNEIMQNIIRINDRICILQSSLKLMKMQTLATSSLKTLLAEVNRDFDWCIIDAQPNFNNIVLNGLRAADLIITPVVLECLFDLKTTYFLQEQLAVEYPDVLSKWKLIFTRVRKARSENSIVHEYEKRFRGEFANILETRIPDTKMFGRMIDMDSPVIRNRTFEKAFDVLEALYTEIYQYADKERESWGS